MNGMLMFLVLSVGFTANSPGGRAKKCLGILDVPVYAVGEAFVSRAKPFGTVKRDGSPAPVLYGK